ncbi:hypothetical protein PRK78_002360 [Emydomyces testavorans]|uniref:HNH domain-containing protein n=1 Tax=Emydomyces testavorans TaxID=2070801 RepID=A0AAF0DEQ2_9EURO|nr:hypothetical protein PRK78_002360 [Emydomyces testavorans]
MTSSSQRLSTPFSQDVTDALFANYSECFVCGPMPHQLQAVHVMSQHDTLARHLRQQQLLITELSGYENAILLCAGCHAAFDDMWSPGFIFLPADLDFFVNAELAWVQEPRTAGQNRCPSADEYRSRQIDQNQITDSAVGGLYSIYLLEPWAAWPEEHTSKILSTPKPWHGAPIAAIRRGIFALGSLFIHNIPDDVVAKLRQLQELYKLALADSQATRVRGPAYPSPLPVPPQPSHSPPGSDDQPPSSERPRKRQQKQTGAPYTRRSERLGKQQIHSYHNPCRWVWGPDSTSNSESQAFRQRGRSALFGA